MAADLIQLKNQIASIEPARPVEAVLTALDRMEFFERLVRELRCELEPRVIAWISQHGAIECGPVRYYVGNKKTTKCLDKRQTIETFLATMSGDLDRFSDVLVAQPFKYGLARTVLAPEDYGRCFISIEEPELREGKTAPKLLRVDTTFLR